MSSSVTGPPLPDIAWLYTDKETARDFLRQLVSQVRHEQSIGWRTPNNLDPKESLDFLIQKVTVEIPETEMVKKGWKF